MKVLGVEAAYPMAIWGPVVISEILPSHLSKGGWAPGLATSALEEWVPRVPTFKVLWIHLTEGSSFHPSPPASCQAGQPQH